MSHPSPNHGDRRGQRVELIVLHYTGMEDGASARARLCDPEAEVSAHWLVHEDGRTEALVPEDRRAWHAGAGSWRGRDDVNSRSIGIEIVNPGDRPFPMAQMDAVVTLLRGISARHRLGPADVIGHSDMAPDRKCDPGPRFDWARQGGSDAAAQQACASYTDTARAQMAFLAAGGPERDPQGMDPDGDGFYFCCDPAPNRVSQM
ncbi:MAG: N-acetylmuramoyl-L-alanine amidase [Paracoccus sp. (in: a-proteobacteria)]